MKKNINSFQEYKKEYAKSITSPELFWEEKAENFIWRKKWDNILNWNFSEAETKWFEGGKLNITENCLDRHLTNNGSRVAIKWIPNNPTENPRTLSYTELHSEVCRFSNALKNNGAKKGDRICLYMPMVPELAIAVLACARIGAIHSVVFAGFSAKSLAERINDAKCNILITADGGFRGEKITPLKKIANEAMKFTSCIKRCIVLQRAQISISMKKGRDVWWHEEMSKTNNTCPIEIMDAEDPLFILYTSGSTGKPKGIQHSIAGYMVYTEFSFRNVFQYNEGDVYWCTADIGWITGHSYIIYGPLLSGATTMMFEGVPSYPDAGRFWKIVEENNVNIFYTAPTAIRALEAKGMDFVNPYDLSSLKVLGTVGEPINEDAWHWYDTAIGKKEASIVDTWWQTETGANMIAPLPGVTETIPGTCTTPLPGIEAAIIDNEGNEISTINQGGNLVIKKPWPSMLRGIWGDNNRYEDTYWKKYNNKYYITGDTARFDEYGNIWIMGRSDDVVNISGHRLGTMEIESAIVSHEYVAEAAVVSYKHDIKGEAIHAFVTLANTYSDKTGLEVADEIRSWVKTKIGSIAKPEKISFSTSLPKTRSGKIMRRLLRNIARGEDISGDTSTLENEDILDQLKKIL